MKRLFILAALVAGAGCGQTAQTTDQPSTTTSTAASIVVSTTATTAAPTTTTTACMPADTNAQETYVDTTRAAIRQTEGAIAQIQLVIDNGTRDRAAALRYQATVQTDYDQAVAAFGILGIDSARDKMTREGNRLADAKDVVASWDSVLAKARGDLSRAQAQKADFEQKINKAVAEIAAASTC